MAIYMWREATPVTTAGIYHNSDLGLISLSSNGSTRYTVADKNLGATTVYNSGDTLAESNCGKYYQRGNNYGFAFTGSISTSSSTVNASTYGPGNYYNGSAFITAKAFQYGGWDTSNNLNLRGYSTGTVEAMKGPCDTGFHIPSQSERANIKNIWTTIGGGASDGTNLSLALKMPFTGWRSTDANVYSQGSGGQYWSSTPYTSNSYDSLGFYIAQSSISYAMQNTRSFGQSIRPFANTATQPDGTRTVLYQ